ncbi:unnamed protein product [Rotaria sordida]|uniref:K Homology domain-containing protein n=1 Tax=Rotaria sordida TaxID=392033 RepID=A0A818ZI67_9BILA|nr:unnamed protein product [Rotaria sordida]
MATNECIVHSRKTLSKFHAAINQLRVEKLFSNDVYRELPKRCCSCNGKQGLKTIELEALREISKDIMLSAASTVKVRFSSNANRWFLTKTEEDNPDEEEMDVEDLTDTTDDDASQDSMSISDAENRDNQHTLSNEEIIKEKFAKVLETFKVTTATDECIVHNPKYRSKFNHAVNLLRIKQFKNWTYHELPKRCCSCNGKTGLNVIDLNVLGGICEEIESNPPIKSVSVKPFHVLTFPFESTTKIPERRTRIRRFIGKKGQNLTMLQDKYNVRIHIINRSSNKTLRKNKLMTDAIPIDEIKREITEKWEEASEIGFIEKEFTFDHTESNKRFQFLSLPFESEVSLETRNDIISRFIGKKGENLRDLENNYNIRIHIIKQGSSNEKYFRQLIEEQEKSEKQDPSNQDDLYVFITKKNKSVTDVIPINEVKEEISKKWKEASIEPPDLQGPFYFLPLSFESKMSIQEHYRKNGRFIGKKGQNLRALQDKYNIYIHIVDKWSSKNIRRRLAKVQGEDNTDNLHLLITSKNKSTTDGIPIDKIKQEIIQQWRNGNKGRAGNNSKKSSKSKFLSIGSTELTSDDRWHPKRIRRGK